MPANHKLVLSVTSAAKGAESVFIVLQFCVGGFLLTGTSGMPVCKTCDEICQADFNKGFDADGS